MIFCYVLSRHCIKGDANPDRTFWRAWASKLCFDVTCRRLYLSVKPSIVGHCSPLT
jgi:hypothetical protein